MLLPNTAFAEIVSGGLWGSYEYEGTAKKVYIENLGFVLGEFESILSNRLGSYPGWGLGITYRGYIYAETSGTYHFRIDTNANSICSIQVNYYSSTGCVSSDRAFDTNLSAGWNRFYLRYSPSQLPDPQLQMFWTPPEQSEEIIPADHLASYYGSTEMITIPASGKQKFDFIAGGVAGRYTDIPEIKLDVPAPTGDPDADWLKDDVWIIWFKTKEDTDEIIVTNVGTDESATITGIRQHEIFDIYWIYQMYYNLPSSLIDDDDNGMLHLKFEKVPSSDPEFNPLFSNGIAIIVPYRDQTKLEGKLMLKLGNINAYRAISPAVYFPVDGLIDPTIDPVFIFNDGETKLTSREDPPMYRPNYVYWMSGSDSERPGRPYFFKNDSESSMLFPESNPLDLDNPNTFYSLFGREGSQLDVLSSRYEPNLWAQSQAQYKNQEEGKINPILIDSDDTWIAFQYTGSNFPEDSVYGPGESGTMAAVGVYTTEELAIFDVDVSVIGDGYIDSNLPGISCPGDCSGFFDDGTFLALTATPNGATNFLGWGGDCVGAGVNPICYLVIDKDQTATASFTGSITSVPGECGHVGNQETCLEPQAGFCASFNTMLNYNETADGWAWDCQGTDGSVTHCDVERNCGWKERT